MQKTSTLGTLANNSNPFLQQILNAVENLFQDDDGPARVIEMIDDMHLSHATDPMIIDNIGRKAFRLRVLDMQILRNALLSMGQAFLLMQAQRDKESGNSVDATNRLVTLLELLSPDSHEKNDQKSKASTSSN